MRKRFDRVLLTEIQPEGWLKNQLQNQMNGLTGNLHEVWDSVGTYSGWLGGTGESWERAPYYLDGLVPLSYYLNDKKMWDVCCRFIEWTLNSQDEEGNYGPISTKNDQWSRFAMLKVLIQYQEITGDERIVPFVKKYLQYYMKISEKVKIVGWSRARVPDLLCSAKWLYDKTGEEEILKWMEIIDTTSLDWCDYLKEFPFPRPAKYYINWKKYSNLFNEEIDEMVPYHFTHIVNITMGFKHPAIRAIYSEDANLKEYAKKGLKDVIAHHGVVSGCINGDEHLAGNSPSQGSELCSIVEYMYSLQQLIEVFGDSWYGDLMERLTYNALPSTITEDFMGHQYLQQANQVLVDATPRPWFNNNNESTIFGLEPNFGCCTANMHQGWPKFVNSLWYKENDDTLVSSVFAPNTISTIIGGQEVKIQLDTEYPFRETMTYRVLKASESEMTLKIRIPEWAKVPELKVDCAEISEESGYLLIRKKYTDNEVITFAWDMQIRASRWYNNSLAIERGPLVYGLDIKERWEVYKEVGSIRDYCIYPESEWNYALNSNIAAQVKISDVTETPFSKLNPPVKIQLTGKKLEQWKLEQGNTTELPVSPIAVDGEEVILTLIPYGCTRLKVTQFPSYVG